MESVSPSNFAFENIAQASNFCFFSSSVNRLSSATDIYPGAGDEDVDAAEGTADALNAFANRTSPSNEHT
jgi:hypothetical protein